MTARLAGAVIGLMLAGVVFLAGCSSAPTPTPTSSPTRVPTATPTTAAGSTAKPAAARTDVSPQQAKQLVDTNKDLFVLDVRNPDEYATDHIQGATLIPVTDLQGKLAQVPHDRPILVYCRTGVRSASASSILVSNGYSVYNLSGGLTAWSGAGYPTVR